jgi:hypothetical protein
MNYQCAKCPSSKKTYTKKGWLDRHDREKHATQITPTIVNTNAQHQVKPLLSMMVTRQKLHNLYNHADSLVQTAEFFKQEANKLRSEINSLILS